MRVMEKSSPARSIEERVLRMTFARSSGGRLAIEEERAEAERFLGNRPWDGIEAFDEMNVVRGSW